MASEYFWGRAKRNALAKLSDAQRFAVARAQAQRTLARLREYDESKHPRDPRGRWTETGGAGDAGDAGDAAKSSNAAALYKPSTKTADEIVAEFPGGAEAINHVRGMLKETVETNRPVAEGGFKLPDGTYTPERAALHAEIVRRFINPDTVKKYTPAPGENSLLTVLGGRGGSGKSWLIRKDGPVDAEKSMVLDSDAIKEMLPEYEGWNAAQLHEEATDIVAMIDRRAAALGMNVILDGTLKSTNVLQRIEIYHAAGDYEMEGYYMYASPETAATRAMKRYAKGGTFKGRFVPPEVILANTKNESNFDALSSRFNFRKWAVYDGDAEGQPPRLHEQGYGKPPPAVY